MVIIVVHKRLNDQRSCSGVVGHLLVGDLNTVKVVHGLCSLTQGKLEIHMQGKAERHDISVIFCKFQGRSILR